MHIFVTGGAGYIGSICVEQLLNAGHTVTVFDNLSEGHKAAVDPRATLIIGDLLAPEQIGQALLSARPDAVMHFAANALVGESMTNPTKYFRNNVTGGVNLLEAMVAATANHSRKMITSPAPIRRNPKKTGVHKVLSAICTDHSAKACPVSGSIATRAAAADMLR